MAEIKVIVNTDEKDEVEELVKFIKTLSPQEKLKLKSFLEGVKLTVGE